MKNNFVIRAITGILFVAVIVGCILWNPLAFGCLFVFISALTIREFGSLVNRIEGVDINKTITSLGGAYLFMAFMAFCIGAYDSKVFIPYVLLILYLLISELYLKKQNPINNWAYSMFSQLYIALPFAMLNVLAFQYDSMLDDVSYNPILPLAVFIFLWLNDTGAYCVGSMFGKHRLFERISPKKSWEGSIGGAVVCVAISFLLAHFFPFMTTLQWIGLSLVIVVFGTWGDLTESLLKRQLHIKDSGTILPGHGGMLDRFDSSLMAIPAAAVYIYLISF